MGHRRMQRRGVGLTAGTFAVPCRQLGVQNFGCIPASLWKSYLTPARCCCCCCRYSLNWGKLGLRYWEVGLRRGAVYTVLLLLALFYVLPVAVVQGLLQVRLEPKRTQLMQLVQCRLCRYKLSYRKDG
jgi:hypothetical protein